MRRRWLGIGFDAFRAVALVLLSFVWHRSVVSAAFPMGGGEAHWLRHHVGPVGWWEAVVLAAAYFTAAAGFVLVAGQMRVVAVLLVAPLGELAAAALGPGLQIGGEPLLDHVISAAPSLLTGLLIVACRLRLRVVPLVVVAALPGVLRLAGFARLEVLGPAFVGTADLLLVPYAAGLFGLAGLVRRGPSGGSARPLEGRPTAACN